MLSIRFAKDKDKTNYKLDISHHPAPQYGMKTTARILKHFDGRMGYHEVLQ